MLELVNIKKDYLLKDQEPVHALKGISLNFRSHEFVAILGHSGCGKTTLLNITGGLDHYDSGDLIIKGISTKDFKDGDWDTYRNHSIGFVFQSYNLIPHQTIIKNVELALTISGIKKEERFKRAKEALDLVGLHGLYTKKPNQLSGGQMQRVAIARALVNNPEIVLADEPTGALDSETSVQIMDILKQISKTHLVIMVTHNPELAEQYASRIVRMKDGEIYADTNPFDGKEKAKGTTYTVSAVEDVQKASKGRKKQSSMSFFTATGLSVSNLLSKFKRTLLVAIAGSIGIIGVSTILGVSCGVNDYIYDMQDDMLSSYPIEIAEESMDMTSLLAGLSSQDQTKIQEFDTTTRVGMDSMISYLMTKYTDFTNVKTNDINQELLKYLDEMPKSYYSAMTRDYGIDPTNNIFTSFKEKKDQAEADIISVNGLTQRYTKTLMSVKGFEEYASFVDLFTNFMKEMPDEEEYILSQYDLLGNSRFATAADEMVLVVDNKTTLTDLIYAQMGYYPEDEFLNIAKKAVKSKDAQKEYLAGEITQAEYEQKLVEIEEKYQYESTFTYEDILGHEFYYYPHDIIYNDNPSFVSHNNVVASMTGLDMSGNRTILTLSYINSSDNLTGTYIVLDSGNNVISNEYAVFLRMSERNTAKSVLDGTWGGATTTTRTTLMLTVNTKDNPVVEDNMCTYEFAAGSRIIKMSGGMSMTTISSGNITEVTPETPDYYYEAYAENNDKVAGKDISEIPGALKMKVVGVLRAKETTNFGTLSRGVYYTKAFSDKYLNDSNSSTIVGSYKDHITKKRFLSSEFNAYVHFKYNDYSDDTGEESYVPMEKQGYSSALNGNFSSNLMSLFFSFMGDASGGSLSDTERSHLRALSGLKIIENEDDYSVELLPQSISIYPKNFKEKDNVTRYLDVWNKEEDITYNDGTVLPYGDPNRSELTYSDTISMIVAAISTLVTTISAALIAFTSLSLVVSCFMIAVITYISVMERVKEIGVIRSLGGRKKDVSRLFTAENLITGFASGAIGILVTYGLQLIINIIVHQFGVPRICALPWYYALMMIGISIVLSVLSGFIPSRSASKQDPVIALRTE